MIRKKGWVQDKPTSQIQSHTFAIAGFASNARCDINVAYSLEMIENLTYEIQDINAWIEEKGNSW